MNVPSEGPARFIPSFICTHKKPDIYTLSSGTESEAGLDFFSFSPAFTALLFSLQCNYLYEQAIGLLRASSSHFLFRKDL